MVGIALWLMTPFLAGQMIQLSIDQMTQRAQVVVQGTVKNKSCHRDSAGRIYTQVELEVDKVLKGSAASGRFTIVYGGGRIGNQTSVVPLQVDYAVGEEVVAFLVLNQRGEGVTVGLMQGKFHVWTDPDTKEKLVWNPFLGRPGSAGSKAQLEARAGSEQLTLANLELQVKGAAR